MALWTHTSLSRRYRLLPPRTCPFENGILTQTGLLAPLVQLSRRRRALESSNNTNRLLSSVYANLTPKFPDHAMVSVDFVMWL